MFFKELFSLFNLGRTSLGKQESLREDLNSSQRSALVVFVLKGEGRAAIEV